MSTRANILILETGNKVWLYHHWDGYPAYLGAVMGEFLRDRIAGHYWDASGVANVLIKGHLDGDESVQDDGFELTDNRHGDIEYLYIIDMNEKTMRVIATRAFGSDSQDEEIRKVKYDDPEDMASYLEWCKTK